jgi:hypothetical protein
MTKAGPGGMGPVADPRDVQTATPMTDADQERAIGAVMLRNGDAVGFRGAREAARTLERRKADEDFGRRLVTMPDEELFAEVKAKINNQPNVPLMVGYDPKEHKLVVTSPDGSMTRMTSAEARAALLSAHQLGQGDLTVGLATMMGAEKQQGDRVRADVAQRNAIATTLAGDYRAGQQLNNDTARTGAAVNASNAAAANSRAHAAQAMRGTPVTLIDKVTKEPVMGYYTPDGKFTRADIPAGLALPRQRPDFTPADVIKGAEMYVGQPNPETGKPYTPQEAMQQARIDLSGTGGAGGVEIDMDKAAEVLKALRQGKPPKKAEPKMREAPFKERDTGPAGGKWGVKPDYLRPPGYEAPAGSVKQTGYQLTPEWTWSWWRTPTRSPSSSA